MPILSRLLILLIFARILVPPGMCLCKLEAPASRAVAWVLGAPAPAEPYHPHDDEHHPGCPASYLSLGLGLHPMPFMEPPPLFLSLPAYTPSLSVSTLVVPLSIGAIDYAADTPLYVSHCALIV